MKKLFPIIVILLILWSCQSKNSSKDTKDTEPLTFKLTELWRSDSVMKTPESVLFDSKRNVLYVANMNRVDEGNTGFISKLATDGTIINLDWISGLKEPRGMGIHGDLLFATDMDRLLVIDIEKGELLKIVPVDGAVFLNDLSVSVDGVVYFSDSRGGKVQKYENDVVSNWLKDLEGPNGLYDKGDHIIVSVSGASEVRDVDKVTGAYKVIASGIGVDGIEATGIDDYYIMSEWGGRIFMVGNDTIQKVLDTQEQKINSADMAYDMEKRIVYVPTFNDNRVVAYKLEME